MINKQNIWKYIGYFLLGIALMGIFDWLGVILGVAFFLIFEDF